MSIVAREGRLGGAIDAIMQSTMKRADLAAYRCVKNEGRRRYGLLFAIVRNGIRHSFLPKQGLALYSSMMWSPGCVDELRSSPEAETKIH